MAIQSAAMEIFNGFDDRFGVMLITLLIRYGD